MVISNTQHINFSLAPTDLPNLRLLTSTPSVRRTRSITLTQTSLTNRTITSYFSAQKTDVSSQTQSASTNMTQSQFTEPSTLIRNSQTFKRKYASSHPLTAPGAIDKYITLTMRTNISTLSSYHSPDYWTHPDDFANTHSLNVLKRSPTGDLHMITKKPRLHQGVLTRFLAVNTSHQTPLTLTSTGSTNKHHLPSLCNPYTDKQKVDTLRPLTAADIDSIASTQLDSSNISRNDYFTIQLGLKTKALKR